jgi:hypothetical protein
VKIPIADVKPRISKDPDSIGRRGEEIEPPLVYIDIIHGI